MQRRAAALKRGGPADASSDERSGQPDSRSIAKPYNTLHFEKRLKSPFSVFASVARLLVTAERRAGVPRRIVQVHAARAEPERHAPGAFQISRLNISREPEGTVVRNRDRFFFVAVRHDREHWAEDLFSRDGHRR